MTLEDRGPAGGGSEPREPLKIDTTDILTSPLLITSIIMVAAALVIIVGGSRDSLTYRLLIGGTLTIAGLLYLPPIIRNLPDSRWRLPTPILSIAVGVAFVIFPDFTTHLLGWLIGGAFAVYAVIALSQIRGAEGSDRWWAVVRAVMAGLFALFGLAAPEAAFTTLVVVTALLFGVGGALAIVHVIAGGDRAMLDDTPREAITSFFRGQNMTREERGAVVDTIFYDGPEFRRRLSRFTILMVLSTIIATFGVLADSTATVIGAMLISPLMTPIMAFSASLTMGWTRRALRAGLTVLFGAVGAVAVAWLLTTWVPVGGNILANSQIASRISPTLLDLGIAVAAGAAGAFAITRPDVSDSLPGVAIAVALVPPLSVVGVTLASGEYAAASGAVLLFLTNFVAIVLFAGAVFVLAGFTPVAQLKRKGQTVRLAFGVVIIATIVIIIPLTLTGTSTFQQFSEQQTATQVTEDWLGEDSQWAVVSVRTHGQTLIINLVGPPDLPPIFPLRNDIQEALGRPVTVEVRVNIEERRTAGPGS